MKRLWNFFASVRLTIALVILICADGVWGSLLAMKYQGFYRALDQKILFPWLAHSGAGYLPLTLWIYVLVFLTALFTVNTAVCTADRVRSIVIAGKPWRSFFPHIVHVGFLIALLGHLAGSVWGFKTSGNILFLGRNTPVPNVEGLSARLDGIDMKATPWGEPESLKARVTLIKEGSDAVTGDIEINGPLIYKGVAFYYSDQGRMPTGLKLDVNGVKTYALFESPFKAPDGRIYRFGEIYPDFGRDERGEPFSRSEEYANPHVEIISEGGQRAFLSLSGPGSSASIGGTVFRLDEFIMTPYVVLSINKDPGIWLIIAGSSVLVAGMALLLFFRGERGELLRR